MPDLQEVKQVVWNLSPTSAAGPDGFPGSFYRRFWDVLSTERSSGVLYRHSTAGSGGCGSYYAYT